MKKKLCMTFLFLCFMSIDPIFALDTKAGIDTLFIDSGLEYQLNNFAQGAIEGFDNQQKNARTPLSVEEQYKIHQIMRDGWSIANLSPIMKDYMTAHLSSIALDKSLKWLSSSLGFRITKLEEESSRPGESSKVKEYAKELNNQPPSPERMDLIKRLIDVTNGAEFFYKIYVAQTDSMLIHLDQSASSEDHANAEKMRFNLEMAKPQIEANARQTMMISGLYTYKDLSNEQLSQYIDFLASVEGKEYTQVTQQALLEAMRNAQQKISDYLMELYHSKKRAAAEQPSSDSSGP